MYKVRNFPTLSGMLTWYNQLERKLNKYCKRLQDVLGSEWEKHVAGRQLKQQIDPIAKHLTEVKETNYNNWTKEMNELKLFQDQDLQIFKLETKSDGSLKLEVNFSEKGLELLREKNNLKALGYKLPYSLIMKTQEVQLCYSKYISMVDNLATFHLVSSKITSEMAILLASKRKGLHSNLKSSDKISWKDERSLESYCQKIASQVQDLEEAAHIIEQKLEKKNEILSQMLT